jgi:hypothetical protein
VQRQAAAAGAAWLLSDCTDTCAYAPRCCLPALAELRKKNLLLLLLTATQLYTQRPTQEDAPHTHNKKEKNPNKQNILMKISSSSSSSFLFLFLSFFFAHQLQQQQQQQKRLSIALPTISSK